MLERDNLAAHYFSLFIAFCASLSLQDWTLLISIFIGVATLFINWYYKQANLSLAKMAIQKNNMKKVNENVRQRKTNS